MHAGEIAENEALSQRAHLLANSERRAARSRLLQALARFDAAQQAVSTYTTERLQRSEASIRDTTDVAAYLATRLPATYAAVMAALDAIADRAPNFAPQSLLDFGAGPGTASWAAAQIWPSLRDITMLDRNPHLLAAARTLADTSPHAALSEAQLLSADITSLPSPLVGEGVGAPRSGAMPTEGGAGSARHGTTQGFHDLILAGYTFAELSTQTRDRVLATLWAACGGMLVIVEPGTPSVRTPWRPRNRRVWRTPSG